jgi:metallo-beta-lactamase family protein
LLLAFTDLLCFDTEMTVNIKFLGAAGTVTGSKYLIQSDKNKLMVDAGFFQGSYEWRQRNWHNFQSYAGVSQGSIEAVLLTHAHLDHSGLLPRLFSNGLDCPIYCSTPTKSLCEILLPDSGRIQEEDAAYRQKKNLSHHRPPLPLYTEKDAREVLKRFRTKGFNKRAKILPDVYATWKRIGHILGAGSINLEIENRKITFSGDVGRFNVPILKNPEPVDLGEVLIIESTYGDSLHPVYDIPGTLAKIINKTVERNGVMVIPSFAIGRTQLILYYLRELKESKAIPDIPVIVDSPMATDATGIYRHYPEDYDEETLKILIEGSQPFSLSKLYFIQNQEESKQLNSITDSMIIISASGMLTGGRVMHHVFHRIRSPLNTILFVGHQAQGTKGAQIQGGAKKISLFKQTLSVRARIAKLKSLSAHGDQSELIGWVKESIDKYGSRPRKVVVTHGEKEASEELCRAFKNELNLDAVAAKYLEDINL